MAEQLCTVIRGEDEKDILLCDLALHQAQGWTVKAVAETPQKDASKGEGKTGVEASEGATDEPEKPPNTKAKKG